MNSAGPMAGNWSSIPSSGWSIERTIFCVFVVGNDDPTVVADLPDLAVRLMLQSDWPGTCQA